MRFSSGGSQTTQNLLKRKLNGLLAHRGPMGADTLDRYLWLRQYRPLFHGKRDVSRMYGVPSWSERCPPPASSRRRSPAATAVLIAGANLL
jgi:hypothetical protein